MINPFANFKISTLSERGHPSGRRVSHPTEITRFDVTQRTEKIAIVYFGEGIDDTLVFLSQTIPHKAANEILQDYHS